MGVKTLQKTSMELQKNMMQMGMITEMLEETMEVDSDEDMEADDIINNIIGQIENNTYDPTKNPLVLDVKLCLVNFSQRMLTMYNQIWWYKIRKKILRQNCKLCRCDVVRIR